MTTTTNMTTAIESDSVRQRLRDVALRQDSSHRVGAGSGRVHEAVEDVVSQGRIALECTP